MSEFQSVSESELQSIEGGALHLVGAFLFGMAVGAVICASGMLD